MRVEYKKVFFLYLEREIPKQNLFDFIYDSSALQEDLTAQQYYSLVSYDWKTNSNSQLDDFLFETCIDKGEYLVKKLMKILDKLIVQPAHRKSILKEVYQFYVDSKSHKNDFGAEESVHNGCTFLSEIMGDFFMYMNEWPLDEWSPQQAEQAIQEDLEKEDRIAQLLEAAIKIRAELVNKQIVIHADGSFSRFSG